MGLFKDDAGKTEKATPERLGQARDKGQTPISKEFTMAGSLLIAVLVIEHLGWWLWDGFKELFYWGMDVKMARQMLEGGETDSIMRIAEHTGSLLAAPYFTFVAIFVFATLLAGFGQIGIKISKKAIGFKPEKLNPVANAGKLFKFSQVMKTLLSALKILVLGSVLYFVLRGRWEDLASMHQNDTFMESATIIFELALSVFFWIAVIVMAIALGDIFYQRYDHQKNLMMTKQEVEDERKRNDGDPFIKGRLKNARLALMKQRMMEAVPKADVIITNPTHYSVALTYDRSKNAAPQVVAKGVDDLALRIREIAKEHDVILMEDPPLARALFRAVEVGNEVPEKFYKAVATVLGHVYRMKDQVA